MRIIIEETSDGITCKVSRYVGKSGHNVSCSTFSNCDKALKKRVKTILMTMLIRITNGEMDQQAQELLEGLVLEQGRQRESTALKKSDTASPLEQESTERR